MNADQPTILNYQDIAEATGLDVRYLRVLNHRGEMPRADARPPRGARRNQPHWKLDSISRWISQRKVAD